MHLIAHHLVEQGQEAYLHTPSINPELKAPKLTQAIAGRHAREGLTPIVMYSESLFGNPLRAACVVRYVGNFLGLLGGPKSFPAEELLLWHSKDLAEGVERGKDPLVLSVPTSDTHIFYPPEPGSERPLSCFYASKLKLFHRANPNDFFATPADCIEITRDLPTSQTPAEIAEIFRRSSIFYAFENTTLSLEAMLCGCPVQLIPNPYFSKPLFIEPIGMDGMAFGFDPKEQLRATQSLPRVADSFENSKKIFSENLQKFIHVSQSHSQGFRQSAQIKFIQPCPAIGKGNGKLVRLFLTIFKTYKHHGLWAIPGFIRMLGQINSWTTLKRTLRQIEMDPEKLSNLPFILDVHSSMERKEQPRERDHNAFVPNPEKK